MKTALIVAAVYIAVSLYRALKTKDWYTKEELEELHPES